MSGIIIHVYIPFDICSFAIIVRGRSAASFFGMVPQFLNKTLDENRLSGLRFGIGIGIAYVGGLTCAKLYAECKKYNICRNASDALQQNPDGSPLCSDGS